MIIPPKNNTNCRIGKVSYKDKNITSFPDRRIKGIKGNILAAARNTVNDLPEIDGFILLAWEKPKGGMIRTFYESGAAREALDLPNYAAELIRWSFKN